MNKKTRKAALEALTKEAEAKKLAEYMAVDVDVNNAEVDAETRDFIEKTMNELYIPGLDDE